MKFNHEQLVEIYSGVKEGCWTNQEIREELIKKLENYFIQVGLNSAFQPSPKD